MSPSTNTQSSPTAYIETLDIGPPIPPTYPTSPSLTKYDLYKIQTDMKSMNDNITAMI